MEQREPVLDVMLDSILAMRTEERVFVDDAIIGADFGAGIVLIAMVELAGE
ncbi:MAG: hypothetical protein IT459_23120 [Planctomycetes bacterium]|nr:hypothetical protein [Planctomycetota bacterium]